MTSPADERPSLEERLAAILARPRRADVVRAMLEAMPCGVRSCGRTPARLFPRGRRCDDHAPAQPRHAPPLTSSPASRPVEYGTTTGDPAGRNGPGWELGKTTRLPRWTGTGDQVRRPA